MIRPNGIRTESAGIPFAYIDTRYVTPLDATLWIERPSIYLTVRVARGPMDGPLRDLSGAGF